MGGKFGGVQVLAKYALTLDGRSANTGPMRTKGIGRKPRLPIAPVTKAPTVPDGEVRPTAQRAIAFVERAVTHLLGAPRDPKKSGEARDEEKHFTAERWNEEVMHRERLRQHIIALAYRCHLGFKLSDMNAKDWLGRVGDEERAELERLRSNCADGSESVRTTLAAIREAEELLAKHKLTPYVTVMPRCDVAVLEHLSAPKSPGKGDQGSDAVISLWRRPYVELLARLAFCAPVEERKVRDVSDHVEVRPPVDDVPLWSNAELARMTLEACEDWNGPDERTLAKRIGEWLRDWKQTRDGDNAAAREAFDADRAGTPRAFPVIPMMPGYFGARTRE